MLKPLTNEQQIKVEENMAWWEGDPGLCAYDWARAASMTMTTCCQIGCIGLCKAAQTDQPGYNVAFSTYAYRLIRNEIYTQLEYATRRGREVATIQMRCRVRYWTMRPQNSGRQASVSFTFWIEPRQTPPEWLQKGCRPSGCSLKDTATVRLENCLAYRPTMLQRGLLRRGRS